MSLRALQGTAGGTAPVGGSGTAGTIPVWAMGTTLTNSGITDNGATVSFVARNLASTAVQTWTLASATNALVIGGIVGFDTINSRFGVGTSSPQYKLDVVGQGRFGGDLLVTAGSVFKSLGTAYLDSAAANPIIFRPQGSEAARIDSAGRFLLGTSTAPAASGVRSSIASASSSYLSFSNTTTNTGILFGFESPKGIFYTASGAIGSESYVISYTFSNSGVQLGTTAGMSFDASGSQQGLKLPATPGNTDPNTIDCYVDGGTAGSGGKAWTIADNSGAGLALSITSCEYIQVGKKVTICVDVTFPATASVANASLTLPIGAKGNWHAGSVAFQSAGAGGLSDLSVMCSGAEIAFYSGSVSTRRTNADMTGKRVIFSITYFSSQ